TIIREKKIQKSRIAIIKNKMIISQKNNDLLIERVAPQQTELLHATAKAGKQSQVVQQKITNDCSSVQAIENFKISDEEEVQPPSKMLRVDKLEQPHTPVDKWFVNNIDISKICLEYRVVVVKKCESKAVILNAIEELALSHVFVFQEESPHGLCEYIGDKIWEKLLVEFRKLYP
ncbi:115_t:CDS:2, partial [Acaulospora morrowiae]